MIVETCRYCWKFCFEPKEVTHQLQNLSLIKARSEEAMNIKVIEKFIYFLKRVETQNFDIGWRNHEASRLIGFSRFYIKLESIFLSFLWFSRFTSWCKMNVWCYATCQPNTFLAKRKGSPIVREPPQKWGVRLSGSRLGGSRRSENAANTHTKHSKP
jgi:hypothetical protein